MLFLEFNENNYLVLKRLISEGKKIFLLVYSNSCGACKEVLPEWDKLGIFNTIKTNDVIIAKFRIVFGKPLLNNFPRIKEQQKGTVPKILYINGQQSIESFSGSERTANNFINWIQNKLINN